MARTNPYTTIDNLQRTISVSYRDVTQFVSSSSNFSSETLTAGPTWAYPITETSICASARYSSPRRCSPTP